LFRRGEDRLPTARAAGSFPVVRTDGTILNGHKQGRAAEVAGLGTRAKWWLFGMDDGEA
jgi:hypothetical protein